MRNFVSSTLKARFHQNGKGFLSILIHHSPKTFAFHLQTDFSWKNAISFEMSSNCTTGNCIVARESVMSHSNALQWDFGIIQNIGNSLFPDFFLTIFGPRNLFFKKRLHAYCSLDLDFKLSWSGFLDNESPTSRSVTTWQTVREWSGLTIFSL